MFGNVFLMLLGLGQPSAPARCCAERWPGSRRALVRARPRARDRAQGRGRRACVAGGALGALGAERRAAARKRRKRGGRGGAAAQLGVGVGVVLLQCFSGASYVVAQRRSCAGLLAAVVSGGGVPFSRRSPPRSSAAVTSGAPARGARAGAFDARPALLAGALLFSILGATVYNYVVIAWATGRLGATSVTLFTLLQFPLAAAAAGALRRARVGWLELGGSAAIFGDLRARRVPGARRPELRRHAREAWAAAPPPSRRRCTLPRTAITRLNAHAGGAGAKGTSTPAPAPACDRGQERREWGVIIGNVLIPRGDSQFAIEWNSRCCSPRARGSSKPSHRNLIRNLQPSGRPRATDRDIARFEG